MRKYGGIILLGVCEQRGLFCKENKTVAIFINWKESCLFLFLLFLTYIWV